jgi:hypothetical protein
MHITENGPNYRTVMGALAPNRQDHGHKVLHTTSRNRKRANHFPNEWNNDKWWVIVTI